MSEKSFAENLTRLEEITKSLENGDCSLEEAMTLYEEGKKLSELLSKKIKEAKLKIEVKD